ncbi:MAG: Amuc_1099 family pilus-like system protein [Chthoniobacteraceae bacterium]
MDWIKKHTDQFALALLALVLVALSVLVFLKTQGFAEGFSAAMTSSPHSKEIPKVDTTVIETAQKQFVAPKTWMPGDKVGSAFVSWKLVVDPKTQQMMRVDVGGMLHPPVPNVWLNKHGLDLLASTVLKDDADGDGFSNLEEYQGEDRLPTADAPIKDELEAENPKDATNPKDKNAHPPYYTKLFLKEWIRVPFRLLFNSYDGDPKRDKPEVMNFQINTVDLRQPSEFLQLGATVANTKFKLIKFEYKTKRNDKIEEDEDASELTLQNAETKDTIVLVYNKVIDSPDSKALFNYLWPDSTKPQAFEVKKPGEFVLKPNVQERYKLIDINKDGALIQLPGGDKTYNVPLLQKAQ